MKSLARIVFLKAVALIIAGLSAGCFRPDPAEDLRKAEEAFAKDDLVTAAVAYQDFIDRYPDHYRLHHVHFRLAQSFFFRNQFIPAIQEFTYVIEHYPGTPQSTESHWGLAQAYENMGDYEKAEATYRHLHEILDPTDEEGRWQAAFNLGHVLRLQKRFQEARLLFLQCAASDTAAPKYVQSHMAHAQCFIDQHEWASATAAMESILKEDIGEDGRLNVGLFMASQNIENKRPEFSLVWLDRIIAISPCLPASLRAHIDKGNVLRELDRVPEAIENYRKATERYKACMGDRTDDYGLHMHIALIEAYCHLEDIEKAERELDRFRARFPEYEFTNRLEQRIREWEAFYAEQKAASPTAEKGGKS